MGETWGMIHPRPNLLSICEPVKRITEAELESKDFLTPIQQFLDGKTQVQSEQLTFS